MNRITLTEIDGLWYAETAYTNQWAWGDNIQTAIDNLSLVK